MRTILFFIPFLIPAVLLSQHKPGLDTLYLMNKAYPLNLDSKFEDFRSIYRYQAITGTDSVTGISTFDVDGNMYHEVLYTGTTKSDFYLNDFKDSLKINFSDNTPVFVKIKHGKSLVIDTIQFKVLYDSTGLILLIKNSDSFRPNDLMNVIKEKGDYKLIILETISYSDKKKIRYKVPAQFVLVENKL